MVKFFRGRAMIRMLHLCKEKMEVFMYGNTEFLVVKVKFSAQQKKCAI